MAAKEWKVGDTCWICIEVHGSASRVVQGEVTDGVRTSLLNVTDENGAERVYFDNHIFETKAAATMAMAKQFVSESRQGVTAAIRSLVTAEKRLAALKAKAK